MGSNGETNMSVNVLVPLSAVFVWALAYVWAVNAIATIGGV
jgi:hypothetical protein